MRARFWKIAQKDGTIAPGEQERSVDDFRSRAIRSLQCKLAADDIEQALRSTVLEIKFDGEPTVWCPIGEFFGTGYKLRPYQTWYTEVDQDGTMSCAWVMPFERRLTLDRAQLWQAAGTVDGKISHSDWNGTIARCISMRPGVN